MNSPGYKTAPRERGFRKPRWPEAGFTRRCSVARAVHARAAGHQGVDLFLLEEEVHDDSSN
jgi:hypothetical protein